MKINAQIIISDGVMQNQSDGVGNIIQNPTLLIQLPFMPSAASMTLTIVIGTYGEESLGELIISTKIFHKETEDIVFNMEPNKIGPFPIELKKSNIVLNTDLRNIPIRKEGEYAVEVVIGEHLFEQSFFIAKTETPEL